MNVIGIDIGGTKIFAARYPEIDAFHEEASIFHLTESEKGQKHVLKNIINAIKGLMNTETTRIGISWAGVVNAHTGTILKSPNIKEFDGFALTKELQKVFSIPIFLENDARCFALAEYFALSDSKKCVLGLIFGTGVGAGLVYNGNILHGSHFAMAEVGHQTINGTEAEELFAGRGISALIEQGVRALDLTEATTRKKILEITKKRRTTLVHWLKNLCFAYDPAHIVFGGGIGVHFWGEMMPEIQKELKKSLEKYPLLPKLHVSHMKNAGAVGAGLLSA